MGDGKRPMTQEDHRRRDNYSLYEIIDILRRNHSFYDQDRVNIKIINNIKSASERLSYKKVTRTSIRNIYNAFKDIEMQLNQLSISSFEEINIENTKDSSDYESALENKDQQAFKKIEPIIILMKGKVNYLVQRKIDKANKNDYNLKNAYNSFNDFIQVSIDAIDSEKEFDAFIKIFECMYGFLREGSDN